MKPKTAAPFRRLALAGLVLVLAASAADAFAAKPKIVFPTDAKNFGKIKQGEEAAYEFVFRNDGDAVLTIKNVETSCGCTAALVSDRKVEPGKSGKIKIVFNSQGYAGEVTKYVFVDSDDPATPRAQLKISAAVDVPPQPRIDLDRYAYDAGLLVEGEPLEGEVTVKNLGELELKVDCQLDSASFTQGGRPVKFPIRIAAGKDVQLGIVLPLVGRVGLVREYLLFKSNDPLRSTISMNLNGYVVTKVQLKGVFQKYKDVIK
jgi:hypothetical protein